jgi:two-component system NtrC family sensor kinase
MNFRRTIILLLALLFAVLTLLEIGVQHWILMPSFAELERDDAKISMRRIEYALKSNLDSLALGAADWGNWADVYQFVEQPSSEFIAANITTVALKQLRVNLVMIVDERGSVILSSARDLESGEPLRLDIMAADTLPADLFGLRPTEGRGAEGLIRTNLGIMLIAAAPILDGSGVGPSRGRVVMGRLLDARLLSLLGAQAQADLTMPADAVAETDDRVVETDRGTQLYRTFPDVNGRPLLNLRVEVPRRITDRGHRAVAYASAYLIAAGAAVMILLLVVLNRMVIAPLLRVTQHAVAIGEGADLSARLDLPGNNEVAVLAREFDRMVGRVAESRRLLVDQSFESGFAELAKGVLHNLGNAMTPLAVRLANLSDALRVAPIEDLELAVAELNRESAGSEREADLREFIRLCSRELQSRIAEARDDLTVIQRQTNIVQSALVELMTSTRNDYVIESVRLPELIQQTLEIVPDASRQRLRIESDDSLKQVGAVRIARTVLRLVLQNLIINAADAVRDDGRGRGVLRVVAAIEPAAERSHLHLRCEDNGVGIEAHNLQRIFEPGFSTKSRSTNHGIGLHWCANAVAALGGRIWAASEGHGHGTAVHVVVPLS